MNWRALFGRAVPAPAPEIDVRDAARRLGQVRADRESERRRAFHRKMREELGLPPDPRLEPRA